MKYIYDIELNFFDDKLLEFYEWEENDLLDIIKKIPIFKVSHQTLYDFILFNPIVNEEFLDCIYKKCEIYNKNSVGFIDYAIILCDETSAIAVEFNSDGKTIAKSKLPIDSELNVIEIANTYKESNIIYKKNKIKNVIRKELRKEEKIKKIIKTEIKNLYEKKFSEKLEYIYYEWKNKYEEDIEKIYKELMEIVEKCELDENVIKIYNLINLSYKKNR